jgi:hypothetical protein
MSHIVVTGNPVDGFQFHGPFPSGNDAAEWAEQHCAREWWLIAPLEEPEVDL